MKTRKKTKKKILVRSYDLSRIFAINKEESFTALDRVNFSVAKGDFLSIMGPSGSGKSTLLYLLGGLDEPDKGCVIFDGDPLSKLSKKQKSNLIRKEIGFIFQFYNLVPNLSVEDNILLPIILDGKNPKKIQEKLEELLKIIGIEDKRKSLPRDLSGGQQQRVAIARALIIEPSLILADEPIGNLDSANGTAVMELLQDINQRLGTTIIQVTHSKAAAQYGNRIIHMKDGNIVKKTKVQPRKKVKAES